MPATTAGVAGQAAAGASAKDAPGAPAAGGPAAAGSGGGPVAAGSGGSSAAGGPAPTNPTGAISVWIAGDSTVANGNTPCPVGWGADFQSHFGADVKVENGAVGGRSVRTWMYNVQTTMDSSGECVLAKDASGQPTVQARWQRMLDGMKSGDYLLIQFGINDSSPTCDRHVGINAFKDSFGVMAQAAKQRGAQPVFLTPVSALACQGNTAQGTRGAFVTATLDAGKQFDVPVIDLHARSVERYNELGLCPIPGGGDVSASTGGKAGAFFCDDHTHFDRNGAQQIGELIVKALRDQKLGLAERLR